MSDPSHARRVRTGWIKSKAAQSLTLRIVCKTVQNPGSHAGCSIKPNWIHGLHPAPSACRPRTAPHLNLWRMFLPMLVDAIPWRPFGHAAVTKALVFSLYGHGDSRKRSHMSCKLLARAWIVWLVCWSVSWRCAPKFLPPCSTRKPDCLSMLRPPAERHHTYVFRLSNCKSTWAQKDSR